MTQKIQEGKENFVITSFGDIYIGLKRKKDGIQVFYYTREYGETIMNFYRNTNHEGEKE